MQDCELVKNDVWVNIHNQLDNWKEHGLVIYFEAHDHDNGDPKKNVLLC